MSRRYRPEFAEHLAGVAATFERACVNCDDPIVKDQRIIKIRDGWVHVTCHPGWRQ